MKNLIFIISVLILFACNSSKKVSSSNLTASTNQNTIIIDTNYRFIVSFISIGSGTDKKAKQQYSQFLSEYEQKNKVKLNYETTIMKQHL